MYGENINFLRLKRKFGRKRKIKKIIQSNFFHILTFIIFFSIIVLLGIIIYYKRKKNKAEIPAKPIVQIPIKKNNDSKWFLGNITEIIDNYMNLIPREYEKSRNGFRKSLEEISSLNVYSENDEKNIKLFRDKMSEKFKKNASLVKNLFITKTGGLGNQICALNNIIFYSEILGIQNIYLNAAYNNWYIKDKVSTDKISISLLNQTQINCNSIDTFCGHIYFDFFFPVVFKPTARAIILKDEIKRNMPIINTDKDDLYIYIRTGDVFENKGNSYSPSPYCFYQKILKQFSFKNIYLISMDDKSPIIERLLSEYPNIIHQFHSVDYDFSTIMNAHNLVNCYSSFAQTGIFFNDVINNLWEFDFYKLGDRVYHFHHDFDKLNREFNIYIMKPSENYTNIMFDWRNEEYQKKVLFEENCKYDFVKKISIETLF